ncbi:MAG: putative porin [Proteobacteria bacterium]|nr:putative porin [Pseudomonadota bacterium]
MKEKWTHERVVKYVLTTMLFIFVLFLSAPSSYAGEVDILIKKLVEKGVLSPGEAQQILTETKEETRKQIAKGESDLLPKWVQNTKFKGDLRLRYQWQDREEKKARHRGRVRFRFGAETKVLNDLKVGFRLASGGTDPRSTNQTFQDSFSSKGINLDMAYAQWEPTGWFSLIGGKFKNPLWRPSDLIWDGDINPEGGAAHFNYKASKQLGLFANAGFFILDEVKSSGDDPLLWIIQPGFNWKINDKATLKAALSYYGFSNVEGHELDHSEDTNTRAASGGLKYDFDSIVLSAELGTKPGFINYAGIFGDYVNNTDPSDDDSAWLIGLKFGDKKVKKKGQWQAKYSYRRVERDSILDTFPDSDFFSGKTNVKGHEGAIECGLAKNVSLGLDYYHTEELHGNIEEDLLQFDWKVKF